MVREAELEKKIKELEDKLEIYLKACQAFRAERNEYAIKVSDLEAEVQSLRKAHKADNYKLEDIRDKIKPDRPDWIRKSKVF